MPIEIRRFGVGHRHPDGPAGTTGIEGQVIEGGPSGVISELAFGRRARIVPHTNPNACWFLVIEGGGWVGVGDERTRVTAGEAVAWPADVLHAAWTDGAPMRAIVVELPADPRLLPASIDGTAGGAHDPASAVGKVARGEGALAPRPAARSRDGAKDGEPL
jgi:quercetin dioxygenase-like cupin family protein